LLPGLHIAHGVPGVGKTAFALQIASTCQCPCLYVTCEMSPLELLRRLTARLTGKYLGKFKTGELDPRESSALVRKAIQATPLLTLLDATTAYASPQDILEAAEATRTLLPDSPHFLMIVDSLHSWADASHASGEEYDRISESVGVLRQIASRLDIAVLAIAERNRQSMRTGGLSAAAGSRKVEYGAETVFDLDCEDDPQPDAAGEIPVTLRLRKNRNGTKGKKFDLCFHGALQRYREA
jgi:replicative DNA helicase